MNPSPIRNLNIASISDIHLGHKKNVTEDIVKNLNLAFPDNAETAKLDIIFVCGDVFDTLLFLSQDDVGIIKAWVARLLRICKKYDIMLRVLEGTPSHDRKQSTLFPLINDISCIGADLKYQTELCIEHIDKFDIDILYIPDEWSDSPEKTFDQVIDAMQNKGLSKVDFCVMHGAFKHQLHPAAKAPTHDADHYLSIVKEYVFVGHIHHHSTFKRILAQGSFDRLAHGEEEPKGHLRLSYDAEGYRRIRFIENKKARVFKTIDCTGMDITSILNKVAEVMDTLPANTFVRIEAEKENPIFTTFEVLIRQHPLVTWSKLPRDDEEEEESVNIVADEDDVFIPITITKDNIQTLLMSRLVKQGVSDEIYHEANRLLLEVI